MTALRPAHGHALAAIGFCAMAVVGIAFALLGPVSLIRSLGMIAAVAGVGGVVLHGYFVREFHPRHWRVWTRRVQSWRGPARTDPSAAGIVAT